MLLLVYLVYKLQGAIQIITRGVGTMYGTIEHVKNVIKDIKANVAIVASEGEDDILISKKRAKERIVGGVIELLMGAAFLICIAIYSIIILGMLLTINHLVFVAIFSLIVIFIALYKLLKSDVFIKWLDTKINRK